MAGVLYIVATPIGNLEDITFRAVNVLSSVDVILAEDTRHALKLLQAFKIKKPMLSLHAFNEAARLPAFIQRLQAGESIALISDAGTPLISDPGFPLVLAAKKAVIRVVPIPGPAALITALQASGLPTDRFLFEGFLPAKKEAREQYLKTLLSETGTMIFYEAPHRLVATLSSLSHIFGGDRLLVIARELTKIHEEITMHTLCEWLEVYSHLKPRGEIVLLLQGGAPAAASQAVASVTLSLDQILTVLLAALPLKQAVSIAAALTGERKNVVYEKALLFKYTAP